MNWLGEFLLQTLRNVWAHKLRSALTMFGIAWGIASIIFMMAIGDGFKIGYRQSLYALGTDIAILWGGRTSGQAASIPTRAPAMSATRSITSRSLPT